MARVKANYPDWVMKYKQKGYYINFVKPDKYYLYRAHSVREKGTGKVRRVSDGYVGRITENDGLFLSKKNRPPEDHSVYTLEYGLSYVIRVCTPRIHQGLKTTYPKNGTIIYVLSILNYIYGFHDANLLKQSYLSVFYHDIAYPDSFSESLSSAVDRGTRMITETIANTFHENVEVMKAYASSVSVIRSGSDCRLADIPPHTSDFFKRYRIKLGEDIHAEN